MRQYKINYIQNGEFYGSPTIKLVGDEFDSVVFVLKDMVIGDECDAFGAELKYRFEIVSDEFNRINTHDKRINFAKMTEVFVPQFLEDLIAGVKSEQQ